MKTLIATLMITAVSLTGILASASAEAKPNGYNVYHPSGKTTMVRPNSGGGYNVYHQNGQTTMIQPN